MKLGPSIGIPGPSRFVEGGVVPPPYSPLDEGNAVAWFDMKDPTAFTLNGGLTAVTEIKNKISGVQWATPVNDVPYEAAGLSGHPCLHPIVVGDRFVSSEAAVVAAVDCPNVAKPYTLYWIGAPDVVTTGGMIFGAGNSGVGTNSTRAWGHRSVTNQFEYLQALPAVGTVARSVNGIVTTAKQVICWFSHSAGVGQKMRLNNVATPDPNDTLLSPAYVPGVGPNQVALFCRPDSTPDNPCTYRLGELWLFTAEHDATTQTRVYDYLTARWP